ncbi:MAG TPA: metallophosphoesterase [Verrucomicrobiae bacterium]|nr:metallophosphoesterase [Verrucomicrobiae bacterium]
MRIAQISDTHFGTERAEVVAALSKALHGLAPDVILLCGDITQRARRRQFDAAKRFMDALPGDAQRLVIPGNHDLPVFDLLSRVLRPYAGYTRAFGARESLWHAEGVAILALDATHPKRRKDGALPPAHLRERLAVAREACGEQGWLVVAAHQPLWTAWGEDKDQTLIDRHESARLLAEARADVVLSGHVHVPLIATSAASDPQLAWRFVMSGSGTAVSRRTRPGAPNSFNLLTLDERADAPLHVTRHDYGKGGFAIVHNAQFRRVNGTGWEAATQPAR